MEATYVALLEEKKSMERKVDSILKEMASVKMNLAESNRLVDALKREINDWVSILHKVRKHLLMKIADLENKHAMSSDSEAKMRIEIDLLAQEKQEIQASYQKLIQEKVSVSQEWYEAFAKIEEQSAEFKNTIARMEDSDNVQINRIKQLETEISNQEAAFDQATAELKTTKDNLAEETRKRKTSNNDLSKLQKGIKDSEMKLSKRTAEKKKLVAERNRLAKSLDKTSNERDDTKAKLKHSEDNKNQILEILKTAKLVRSLKEGDDLHMGIIDQDIRSHVKEIEAIKKSVKDKERTVEELKIQLELVTKKKSFWTMVSSATCVLAAVSLAYAAGGS